MEKYDSIPSLSEQQTSRRVFTILVVLAQALGVISVVLVVIWMGHFRSGFAWTEDPDKEFNYHPVFMVIGMIFLYADAIIAYRVFRNNKKICIKILHAAVQGLVLIFAGIGLKAVFDSHNLKEKPIKNLYSLHSWLGITTIVLFSLQWFLGFVSFLLPWCSTSSRIFFKPFHVFFGAAIFVLAVATALTGITEKALWTLKDTYAEFVQEGIVVNFLGIFLVLFAMTVVFIVVNPNYKRQPLPEEDTIQLTN